MSMHWKFPFGRLVSVLVSHVDEATGNVFLQINDEAGILESLMSEIEHTIQEESLKALRSEEITVGSIYLVQYQEDNVWYRARVLSYNAHKQECEVFFFDYGNTDFVPVSCMRVAKEKFCELPSQSFECELEGIHRFKEDRFGEVVATLNETILEQELFCKAVQLRKNCAVVVHLFVDDKGTDSVFDKIKARFATGTDSQIETNSLDTSSHRESILKREVKYDVIRLAVDSFHDLIVTWVEDPSHFWCQLLSKAEAFAELMEDIAAEYANLGPEALPLRSCTVGYPCCAKFYEDESWNRGIITNVSSIAAGQIEVRFVDFGNSQKTELKDVRDLKNEFLKFPCQAIYFTITGVDPNSKDGLWADEAKALFEKLIKDKHVVGLVVNVESDGRHKVKLIDTTTDLDMELNQVLIAAGYGVKSSGVTSTNTLPVKSPDSCPKTAPPPVFANESVEAGVEEKVLVTTIVNPSKFFCQLFRNGPKLENLMQDIGRHYSKLGTNEEILLSPSPGDPCCAQFSEDGCWYRAVVLSANSKGVAVQYIDYGNSETLPTVKIKKLIPKFSDLPKQAIECTLNRVKPRFVSGELKWRMCDTEMFKQLALEKAGQMTVVAEDNSGIKRMELVVRNKREAQNISEQLVISGNAMLADGALPASENWSNVITHTLPRPDVKVGHFEDAVVSYTENPGNFWCQLLKTSTELHSLMKEITIEYSKAAPRDSISKPSCGMLCCAQFTDDDAWYRGKITGIKKGGLVEVHFVDYGNYETLPLSRVKALKANYMKLPVQAIHCELAKLQVKSEALLSDNVMIRFEELTLDKELVIMADRYDEEHDTYAVVLFDTSEGKNLDIALELRSIAEPSRSHEATCIPSLDLQPGITEHVFVSFVASPRKFFCQLMKKADSLDELMGEMSEYYSSLADREGELAKPVTGEFCAAQFSLDDAWYRAQVLDVQGSHISVSYIDFGNSETLQLTRVKVLNTKFQNLPIQALECCFPKVPRGCTDAEFQELVAEKEFNACIVSVKSGVAEVDLLSKESKESLCDILIKGAINSEQLVPSTCRVTSVQWKIGDHVNVSIPFAESVQKFFCQATKHSNELNDLMNRMGEHYSVEQEHLSSVEIGSLYAAWYEEGGWYRAMVNHVQGESIDVFYIDYGDTATIALSGLRTLEDDFSLLPAQAVQCCLKGFSTNPEPAKFVEIAIEQEFEAQVVNVVNGVFEVELVSRDGLLSQMLVKEGEPPATSTCDVSSIQWSVGDKIQVFVPYVESAQKFFCQASPNVAELDGLMNRLEEHYSTSQATVTSISSGSFCVALYEEGGWYRARVNQVQSGTVEVFYIDYGDTATLPLNNIRTIEPEFSSLPAQAVQCCLRGFSVNGGPANFKDHVVEQEFEAQVISVKNGVFEIELFSDGDPVSQMLAKEMVPSVTPICNVSNIHWNVGDKIQVFIPYVESVHKFFCQPSKHTSELEKLMNRLEEHYSTSQATVTSISSRSFCVALYEEGGWYRARVNQVQSGTVEVFYIDYGDTATLPLNSIHTIEPEFSSLPAQAVQCCLKGFSVNGGPVNFKDHVIEQELEAQVISVKNGVFEIELFSDGEPVSQMLAKEMVPSVTPICNVSNIQWNVGDKIQVFIPYVESVHKFFCQPSKHTSELDELMNKLEEHYNTSQANVTSISLGSFCVALYEEGGWYRARVNQVQSGSVEVFYIDYGDTATLPLNSIRTIEPEFSSLPAQAVQCCLKGFSANGGPVNFKDLVIEQEFEAQVTHVKNSTIYEVELVTKESAFMSKKLIEESQPGASPLVGIKEGMYVDLCPTACISPHLFYCQIMTAEHKENLEQLMNQLQQHYDTINKQEGCISEPRIGMLCAAIFGGDGLWYRGKVSKVLDEQTVEVFYLDYGNCETVELGELKLLKEEWTSLAAEAVRCSMPLICPVSGTQWPNVTIDRFNYLTEHKQLVGKIMKLGRDSSLELELYDTTKDSSDINIGELLVKEGLACYSGSSKPVFVVKNVADLGQSKFSVKERVFVTAVETPECFYCQISGNESKLTALMDQIAAAYDSLADDELSFSFISPGNLCCAQFSEDSLWYRAALEGQTANSLTVRFIDYGNTETLPVNKVKILKDDFLCLPPLAIQCSLYGVKPAGSQYWVDEASVMFEELTSGKSLEATFMSSSVPKPFEVQLLDCGTDIADELVKSKLALLIERATKRAATTKEVVQDYRRPLVECGQIYDVYITYIASAGTFYCQLVNLSEQLDGMMNDLNNHYFQLAETEGCVVSPAIGQPCVALFEEMWYRAKVLHVSVNDVTVHYVDYGNTEAVKPSGVKQIVSPFLETPVTAVECSLDLGRESWSEEATSLLEKLTGSEIRTIKVVSQQKDRFEVKVFGDMAHCISDEVLQKLKETDEEQINKEEETLKVQYLEAGQAEKLYVVHTKNSEEFYVQLSKSYAELEKMMEDIAVVYSGLSDDVRPEDLVVGTPCCALFAHDNCWYRAVITCIASDFEVEVHYVDYGNTAVVLLSDIRKLGRRFFSLPVQAICCCLDFTSNKFDSDQTSFQQQVDDKELLGQFLSLNGDKWKVRLFDHDKEIGQDPAGLYDAALEDEESLFEIREYIQHAIAPEEKHRVYVSHVVSPDEFYVQFELMLDDLALLGQEISQFYSILDPTSHVLRKPCPGMSCCAKFSEDSAWYRGRVNHVVPSGLNVKFIDYGNDELVSLKDVKDIDKNFIHLPQQAILCALDASKDLWTTEERAIFKSVTLDKSFDAKFITRDGQRWRISLGLDTVSVVDMFMTKDVTLFQQAGSDILGLQTRTFLPALVTPGQVEEVYMSHVTQSGEFYVQLSRTAPDLNTVENLLCELYEGEAVSRLAVEVCFADSLCCAKFSEDCKWYRALVTKVLSDSQVEVIFVDYGNSEIVTVESIKQLKPELLKYPVQSIKCRLDGSKDEWTAADVEEFEACVLDKPLHVMFTRKEDSSWFVTIKELDMFQAEPTNNKTKTFANETIQLNISEKAYFLSADSPECIWLQLTKTEAALSQVMGQIASEVTDEVLVKSQVVKGLACIGCFTEDDQWYRVQVLDVDSSVKVMYVDYGNTEWLPLDRLRSISDTAMLLPSQAIHCKLSGMQGIEPLKVINYLNDNLSDKVVEVKAESQCDDGSFSVVLYLPGNSQSVNEQIVVDCLGDTSPSQEAQQEQSSPSKPTTPEEIVDVGKSVNDCEVDVSLAKVLESSDDFSGEDQRLVWPQLEAGSHHNVYFMEAGDLEMVQLQLADSEAELSELMKQISIAYTSLGNEELALATPCVGQTCCAQYSEDGGWYRAVITAVSSEGVQVKFVDYGNTDLAVAIKQLKGEFLALPVQCVDCCLKRVVPAPEARKEDIALKLSELCESKLLTAEVTKVSGDSVEIDLFYDIEGAKHSVSESLINFGLAMHSLSQQLRQVSISDGKMVYNNPNLEVGCCYKVTVVCAESPSDFWCYLPETGAELESLSKKIALYYNSLGDNDMRVLCLQVGDVCCAQFSENGQWYRSQVTKLCSDSQVHVLSVDYAKQATLPLGRIKRLDAEFSVVPVQTFHCTLHHVEQPHKYYGEGWSKEAIARFQEMCAEMVITAEIVGVQGNLILVELFTFDNEMVSGKLLSEGLAVEVKPVLGSLPAKAIVNQLGSESSANKVEHCGMESPVNELDEDSVGKIILQDQARPQALKDTNQVDSGTVEKDGQEDDDDEEEFHDSSDQICTESFDCSGEQATMGDVSSDKPQEKEETKLEEDTIVNKALVPETEDQTEEINEIELKAEQGSSEVQKEAEASKTVTGGLSTEKIKHISSDEGIVCCDDISEAQEVKIVEESLDFLKEIIAGDKKLVEKEDQLSEEIQELVEGKIENCVSQEEPGAHVEEMEEQAQAVEWSKERSQNIISQIEEKELEKEEVEEEVKDETSVETGVGAKGGESVQTRTEQIANVIESLETETEQDASGTDSCESGVEEVVAVESLESRIEEVVPVKPLESGIEEVVAVESPETGTQKEAEGSRSPEIRIEDSERIESIETGTEKDVEDVQRLETGTEKEVETIRSPETRIEDSERIESVETGTEKDVEDVQRLETGTEKEVETIRSPETRIEHSESIESVETGTEKEVEDVERLETVTEKDVEGILSLETGIEDVEVIESLDSKVEDLKVNGSLESEAQEEAKERRIIEREKGFQVNAEEKKFQAGEFEEDEKPVAEGFSEEDLTAIIEASNGTEEEEQCDEGRVSSCEDQPCSSPTGSAVVIQPGGVVQFTKESPGKEKQETSS